MKTIKQLKNELKKTLLKEEISLSKKEITLNNNERLKALFSRPRIIIFSIIGFGGTISFSSIYIILKLFQII